MWKAAANVVAAGCRCFSLPSPQTGLRQPNGRRDLALRLALQRGVSCARHRDRKSPSECNPGPCLPTACGLETKTLGHAISYFHGILLESDSQAWRSGCAVHRPARLLTLPTSFFSVAGVTLGC